MSDVTTIIVAAGSGSRFGGRKQFLELTPGKWMLDFAVETAGRFSTEVIVVVPVDFVDETKSRYQGVKVTAGGSNRSESVRRALSLVNLEACRWVLVHDGARPLASEHLFLRVIEYLQNGARAVVPGLRVVDTIKRVEEGRVQETLDREGLRRIQTPQGFELSEILMVYEGEREGSDDASLFEQLDIDVVVVEGEETNIKVTNPSDMSVAKAFLTQVYELGADMEDKESAKFRVGSGYDVHPFDKGSSRVLVLGGVVVPGYYGLVGHSDADVLSHAIADAVLGAAGLSDIGEHFSDRDPRWKDANSIELLRACVEMARKKGYSLENIDSTVICETPKLAPFRSAIIKRLEAAVGAEVNLKAKTAEKLGAIGRSEGIAAFATVLMKGVVG